MPGFRPLSRRRFLASSAVTLLAGAAARRDSAGQPAQTEEAPLLYFDAFTTIGPRASKHPAQPWSLAHVQDEIRHCSIAGALVASTLSVSYDPMWSNLNLSRQLANTTGLFAIWNVMPAAGGEFPPPDELLRRMRDAGVRAVSVHPNSNGWLLLDPASRELFAALSKARILTIVPVAEIGPSGSPAGAMAALDRLAELHPELPLLLTGAPWSQQRSLLPVLRRRRNVHISFDHFQIFNGPEYLVAEGLEDQLVFASDAPMMSMGAHRAYIDYAEIPPAAKRKIAGGNLRRLLGGQGPDSARVNPDEDALMKAVRHGRPLPVPVIDMHIHMLHEGLNGAGGTHRMWHGDPQGVYTINRRLGVIGGAVMSWSGPVSVDAAGGNDAIKAALDQAPPGYFGAPTFDPVHYSAAEFTAQIKQVYADPRMIGMKPYPRYGVAYTDPRFAPWWEFGQARNFYALIHRTRSDFSEVNTLAQKHPGVRWVTTHVGASYAIADQAIESMRRHANTFAEITLTPVTLGVIEYLVKHAGAERVLYGSDQSMRDPRQQLGWVVFSRLPAETKAKILAGNARAVLAPCLARLPAVNRPA